jgi:hypothetical protein
MSTWSNPTSRSAGAIEYDPFVVERDEEEEGGGHIDSPSDDPFDSLVLDEEFVNQAARSEPPARHRAPVRAPISLEAQRRKRRRVRVRRWLPWTWFSNHPLALGVTIIVGLLVVGGLAGSGPLHSLHRVLQSSSTSSQPSGLPSTTTEPGIQPQALRSGDCLTWQQGATEGAPSALVPCSSPHLMEMTRKATLTQFSASAPFPDSATWIATADSVCGPIATAYLGYPLDPNGRFHTDWLTPGTGSWARGDRGLWCGIGSYAPLDQGTTGVFDAFTGVVRGQDQEWIYPTGTCFGLGTAGQRGPVVLCGGAHAFEVTGLTTLPSSSTFPTSDSQWDSAVGSQCEQLATAYKGGSLPAGIQSGWLPLEQSSWNAGERKVQCTIGWYDGAGNLVTGTGTLKG